MRQEVRQKNGMVSDHTDYMVLPPYSFPILNRGNLMGAIEILRMIRKPMKDPRLTLLLSC